MVPGYPYPNVINSGTHKRCPYSFRMIVPKVYFLVDKKILTGLEHYHKILLCQHFNVIKGANDDPDC